MANLNNVELIINDQENVERTLKKFKRLCESYGVAREYRRRKEYKKPSLKEKEKQEAAAKRRTKTGLRVKTSGGKI